LQYESRKLLPTSSELTIVAPDEALVAMSPTGNLGSCRKVTVERDTYEVPFDDAVQAFVLSCLNRFETLLTKLGRLAADPNARQERQELQEAMRRELHAAENVIKAFGTHDPI